MVSTANLHPYNVEALPEAVFDAIMVRRRKLDPNFESTPGFKGST